jgi:16S rRNA (guanine1207-N2)-methyltransferase
MAGQAIGVPDGHYFDQEPEVASDPRTVPLLLPDLSVTLTTDRGVFARDAVDPGTKLLLLDGPPPPAEGDLLDLGCGYGPIALTLARRAPGATVWAVDVNRRALVLTADNAAAAGLTNVRAVEPADLPPDVTFGAVWSNPPVRIGKRALEDLLRTWLRRLAPEGDALLVVHKHLGADSLSRFLAGEGFLVTRLRSRMGYRLLGVEAAP